jgi:chemotaxis protein methyltransferase CheR
MKPANYDFLSKLLREKSGLVLSEDKMYLLENRLAPVARKRGMADLDVLTDTLRTSADAGLLSDVIQAMTVNESYFFRDKTPFNTFKQHTLPALMPTRTAKKELRIWSAAASTGQEPYSLAMVLKQDIRVAGWRFDILGTDLSSAVLEKAKVGLYSQFEVQRGLPIDLLVKYFKQVNDMWQLDAAIRAMVRYKTYNLLENIRTLGTFDVIFCRNVLIYFDPPTKTKILNEMSRMMPPDGQLFLGGAETVVGLTDRFKPIPGQRGVYSINGTALKAAS